MPYRETALTKDLKIQWLKKKKAIFLLYNNLKQGLANYKSLGQIQCPALVLKLGKVLTNLNHCLKRERMCDRDNMWPEKPEIFLFLY